MSGSINWGIGDTQMGEQPTAEEIESEIEKIMQEFGADEIKLFGRWSWKGVIVRDPGLVAYISLKPVYIPHSFGRHEKTRFARAKVNIVERLINRLMTPGRERGLPKTGKFTGKKLHAMRIVEAAFEIIEKRTGENPIQIFVRAVENCAPREDYTSFRVAGIIKKFAVDLSPQRRVDLALKFLVMGARQRAWRSPLSIAEALAEEIMEAAKSPENVNSIAISKKIELERIAEAAR